MSGNIQTQLNQLSANIQTLNTSLANVTGNTLSNYNLMPRMVANQGNIYNKLFSTNGTITTGSIRTTTGMSNIGIGLGTTTGSFVSVVENNDNYNHSPLTISSSNIPYGGFTRLSQFMFATQLTASTPTTILTINYLSSTTIERHIYIKIEAIITASTTGDSSTKTYNAVITGSSGNSTSGVLTFSSAELSSTTASTTSGTLNIGATTISYPTNTASTTEIALSQAITGTASQSFFITGQCTIQQSGYNGDIFITSITI
jgi:hypothetical protein